MINLDIVDQMVILVILVEFSIEGNDVGPHTFEPEFFPRTGVVLKCTNDLDKVVYYGLGPNENYVDSKEAAYMDVFETDVDGLFTNYVYPQENGHHEGCEWLSLGDKVRFEFGKPVGFNVSKYSDEKIEEAKHPYELVEDGYLTLHIDAAMSGLGSNSCGMEQKQEDKVRRGPFNLEFSIEPLNN